MTAVRPTGETRSRGEGPSRRGFLAGAAAAAPAVACRARASPAPARIEGVRRLTDFVDRALLSKVAAGVATPLLTSQGRDAWAAALDAVPATGGDLLVDEGLFLQPPGGLILAKPCTLFGRGAGSRVLTAAADGDRFTVAVGRVTLSDLTLEAAGARSGGYDVRLKAGLAFDVTVEKLRSTGAFGFAWLDDDPSKPDADIALVKIYDNHVRDLTPEVGHMLRIDNGLAVLAARNVTDSKPSAKPKAAVWVRNCGDVTLTDNQFLNARFGLLADPRPGGAVRTLGSARNFYDHCDQAWELRGDAQPIVRVSSAGDWFASGRGGIRAVSAGRGGGRILGLSISDAQVADQEGDGISLSGPGVRGVRLTGGAVSACGGTGLRLEDGVSHVSAQALRVGPDGDWGPNDVNVRIGAGVDWYDLRGDFTGARSRDVVNDTTAAPGRRELAGLL